MNATSNTIVSPEYTGGVNIFRGLMWRHLLAGRWVITAALVVLLTGGWALMLFHHPGWIIGTGSLLAIISGLVFGGSDVSDGSEEFAFALPPTRSQRYVSGLVLGGGTVLAYCLIGVLGIALNLPQYAWSLVVDSGFTASFGPWSETYLYFLAIVIPLLMFACTFACESLSQTRGGMWFSWLPAVGITGLTIWLGCLGEYEVWGEVNGYISVLSMLALAAMVLLFAHTRYVLKEGVSRPGRTGSGGGWSWIWSTVAVVIAVFILMMVFWSHAKDSSHLPTDTTDTTDIPTMASGSTPTIPATTQNFRDQAEARVAEMQAINEQARACARAEDAEAMAYEMAVRSSYSGMAIILPLIVLLIVLIVTVVVRGRGRNARPVRLRGPRKRHIVTRSVCGVLALAILTSIGYFSWQEIGEIYATESPEPGVLRIPSKKAAALNVELKPNETAGLTEARLLIKAIVLESVAPTSFRTVHVDEFDVAWRTGKISVISNRVKLRENRLDYRLNINRVFVHPSNSTEIGVHMEGDWDMSVRSLISGGRSSNGGSMSTSDRGTVFVRNIRTTDSHGRKPLSAVPPSSGYGRLTLCLFVDMADADDELATIPAEQFITERREQILAGSTRDGEGGGHNRRWRMDPDVPPMANLMEHTGISGLLLGLAAILLGQLFMRRGLATAGMLATVVLYAAAIDRIALGVHMSHARDTESSLSQRLVACNAATNTFFFAKTASNQLRAIADDKLTPESLKYRSGRNAILLSASADAAMGSAPPAGIRSTTRSIHIHTTGEKGHEIPRWEIATYYAQRSNRPVTVIVCPVPGNTRRRQISRRMLWRIISSQADPTGRIVIMDPAFRAVAVGEENDMTQAVRALENGKLTGSDVWTRLILPAAEDLMNDQP
jgi:uncharacterized membrane protein